MYIVIFVSLIALALTFLNSRGRLQGGMAYGFILLAFLGAIHYDYGNDYMAYYEKFEEINEKSFDIGLIFSGEVFKEPGWALLCYLFKPLGGFFVMVAAFNIVQNIIREIESNYNQKININELAAKNYISVQHMIRIFHTDTGYTPYEYLKKYRLQKAYELLTHSGLSITEIADRTGFSSTNNFIYQFKSIQSGKRLSG